MFIYLPLSVITITSLKHRQPLNQKIAIFVPQPALLKDSTAFAETAKK
jgi:hypothetical protein